MNFYRNSLVLNDFRYNFGSNPELLFKRNITNEELAQQQQKSSSPYELCNDDILIRRKETLWWMQLGHQPKYIHAERNAVLELFHYFICHQLSLKTKLL